MISKKIKNTIFATILIFISTKAIAMSDLDCLAQAIYGESNGQPKHGQRLVGEVIVNRSKKIGKSVCGVIHQRGQFTYNKRISMKKVPQSIFILSEEILRNVDDISHNMLYFCANRLSKGFGKKNHLRLATVVGGHSFFNGDFG